ncbi:protein kinase-like domain, concanavalin A-like lectin/glucanase domain protein, partial [Tanacetum coccineum]
SNWLERLPAGSITTWEDLTTRFLAQFFTPGRTAKLLNDILMFQQHHGESLSEAWTHARLSKFEADFKQQQNEMTNKIDIVLKAITDRIAGALPSDTVKNPKLSTSLVLSARSYPTEDSQCSTIVYGSINIVTRCPKQPNEPQNDELKEKEQGKEGNPEDTNTMAHNEEQRDTSQLELKDTTVVNNLGPDRIDEGIEWLDIKEPLDLIDTSEELVYESQTQEMPKCSLNYDFRIKKGDPRNLKIPCMIGHRFTANTYIDIDLTMNIMSLAYYNSIRKNGHEYMGINFLGLRRDMDVFVGNMIYVMVLPS